MPEPKLTSPTVIRHLLGQYQIHLKKSLGQNFLADENILELIVTHAQLSRDDIVIEIGAGMGTLTHKLSNEAKHIVAVEIDSRLMPLLTENLRHCSNVTLVNQDFLDVNLADLVRAQRATSVKIVGNLPYKITSPILERLIAHRSFIESACVMVQREVADKLTAEPGNREASAVTIFAQAYANVEFLIKVSHHVFFPKPEVDSALLRLNFLKEPRFRAPEEIFFRVVRAAFNLRRKTLKKALAQSPLSGLPSEIILKALVEAQIDPERRGETLSIDEFDRVAMALSKDYLARSVFF
ncbi:16S rRNA (adenine(1518)-N(6)/adenine(1519)-N(6))-dimethyltransferase RsmA [Candidatus Acetothermia bacterium]|nr:16S rRNA (adenine(1518)-N(6)/adenine(1519)-N(6))-dimethyltransferase RsmA [Candidatus Acetothermia bacterium]